MDQARAVREPAGEDVVDPAAWLDPSQQSVLHCTAPVVRVLGGPGTGKSSVVVALVADRVRRGMAVDGALVLAPTRAAATRLRQRIVLSVGGTSIEPLARTPASLAYAVLRQAAVVEGDPAPTLLTGADQDLVIADLLAGHALGGAPAPDWPEELRPALTTRGFRDQLRELLMRAVEHGVGPEELAAYGRRHGRPEWIAGAALLQEYDQVTALQRPGAYDPAWLCTAAAQLLADDPGAIGRLRSSVQLVVVDDAQELTAPAARLIEAVHHRDVPVVLLGDPDVTSQAFRGAEAGRFVELADRLAARCGTDAAELVLTRHHRLPATLAEAAARVVARIGTATGGAQRKARPSAGPSSIEVVTVRSTAQEATLVAARFRELHLAQAVPWSQLAVIARDRRRLEVVRRTLVAHRVPVAEQAPTGPLREEPAVHSLLLAAEVSLRLGANDPVALSPAQAVELLTSPLGGADPVALRLLRQAAREFAAAAGGGRTSEECLAELVTDEHRARLLGAPGAPATRLASVLASGRRVSGSAPASLLWALWQASGLERTWQDQAIAGGLPGARADRDLDAVMLLFDAAQSFSRRWPGADTEAFIRHVRDRDIAADALVERARPAEAVHLLTPQGAAGLSWQHVAVVGVQEGVWPDLRRRDTLLGAEALVAAIAGRPIDGQEGMTAAVAAVRADELRLCYLTLTRASRSLLVSAVTSVQDQPSVLLDIIDPQPQPRVPIDVAPPLSARSLVAGLRRSLVTRHRDGDLAGRNRVAALLAELATTIEVASPDQWWTPRQVSSDTTLATRGPVRVSPSQVDAFDRCSLRWLLTTRGGDSGASSSSTIGSLVHDIVADRPDGDLGVLTAALDQRWGELGLPPGWVANREHDRAVQMLQRYTQYVAHAAAQGWNLAQAEAPIDVTVGPTRVLGRIDRLEVDPVGAVRVVDLKTGSTRVLLGELPRHAQLGVYQVAVHEASGAPTEGGVLVQLGKAANQGVTTLAQPPLREDPEPGWAHDLLHRAGEGMRQADFPASPGKWCHTCPVIDSCPAWPEGLMLS